MAARLYPNELMTTFNQKLDEWLREGKARLYFKNRDEKALPALNKVLGSLPPPEPDE